MKTIDLYCRVSEDYDGDGGLRSVDDQEWDGRDFVSTLGCCYRVGQVFKDPNLSGWNKKVIRPDFNACMERVARGEAHGLWVFDVTRFSRKPVEGEQLIEAADRPGGHILYSNGKRRDLSGGDDRKWFRDQLTAAENESMRLKDRVTRGKRLKTLRRGKANTSTRGFGMPGLRRPPAPLPEGYAPVMEDEAVVEAEREAVRHVARMMLADRPNSDCFRWLNESGFRTYYGNTWGPGTFRALMSRPSLAGRLVYRGDVVDGALPGEPALDPDTWEAVQRRLSAKRRGPTPRRHLLAGLIRCSLCGRTMRAATRGSRYQGEQKWTYRCSGDLVKGLRLCGKVEMSQSVVDAVVEEAVITRLSDGRHRARLVALGEEAQSRRAVIEAEIAAAEDFELALASKAGRGQMRRAAFEKFAADNEGRMRELRAELDRVPRPMLPTVAVDEARRQWMSAAGNLVLRRAMVREAFPNIAILPAVLRGRNAAQPERIDLEGVSLRRVIPGIE